MKLPIIPQVGQRIELVHTSDEYTALRPGDRGTIEHVQPIHSLGFTQVWVKWDSGSNLMLVPESGDKWKLVKP